MCLDLDKFGRKIEIFGSNDSDDAQFIDLTYAPCDENAEGCRIKEFRNSDGLMETEKMWDALGLPIIEILSRQSRVDQDDPFDPVKTETTLNRSYLKQYTPSWGHNQIRINKFSDSDTNRIWLPFPSTGRKEHTFYSTLHNEDQHRSAWNDFENGRYKFSSYEIFLDHDINYIERRYDTLLNLVSEIGSVKTGLMLIFGLTLSSWQKYKHDQKLASSLLLER